MPNQAHSLCGNFVLRRLMHELLLLAGQPSPHTGTPHFVSPAEVGKPIPFYGRQHIARAGVLIYLVLRPALYDYDHPICHTSCRLALMRKVMAYLVHSGRFPHDVKALTHDMRSAGHYIAKYPDITRRRTGLATILALAELSQRCPRKPIPVPPRPLLWHNGDYLLEELTHAAHLRKDGYLMRNCLAGAGRQAAPPMVDYADLIADGTLRIFSFGTCDRPLVNISYNPRYGMLCNILGVTNTELKGDEPFMPALRDAVTALGPILGIFDFETDRWLPTRRTRRHPPPSAPR